MAVYTPLELILEYEDGHSCQEIALQLGWTAWRVYAALLKAGVKLRSRREQGVTMTCPKCVKDFHITAWEQRRGRIFCSRECYHAARRRVETQEQTEERFWSNVLKGDGCWEWIGARYRYGTFHYRSADDKLRTVEAHSYLWKFILKRRLLPGCNVHHVCGNKFCVRPDHLEQLTDSEHPHKHPRPWFTQTHCIYGHEFTQQNTSWFTDDRGHLRRRCRKCHNRSVTARYYKKKVLLLP